MAEVKQSGGEEKKGKPKKQTLRVDFTPMVDMNMLLITFFMFCTTLSKPQIMDIAMPTDQKLTEEELPKKGRWWRISAPATSNASASGRTCCMPRTRA